MNTVKTRVFEDETGYGIDIIHIPFCPSIGDMIRLSNGVYYKIVEICHDCKDEYTLELTVKKG